MRSSRSTSTPESQSWNAPLYGLVTSPLLHLDSAISCHTFRSSSSASSSRSRAGGADRHGHHGAEPDSARLTTLPGQHIVGASGIVFGFFGYLALRTWFTDDLLRKIIYFAIGLFIFVTYGASMIFGMLPQTNDISWQGHLFGFAGGIFAAWWLHRRPEKQKTD